MPTRKPTGGKPGAPKKPVVALGVKPNLTPAQWAALSFEIRKTRARGGKAELGASTRQIRDHLKTKGFNVSQTAVQKWRKSPHYWRGWQYELARQVGRRLETRIEQAQTKQQVEREADMVRWQDEFDDLNAYAKFCRQSAEASGRKLTPHGLLQRLSKKFPESGQ